MCFFHTPFDSLSRADAIAAIAGLAALPILPSIGSTPKILQSNDGYAFTAIVGTTAFAGNDLTAMPDATVLIHGNRIEAVGPSASITVPDGAFKIDGKGTYTIPGLIDSHVHFFQSGGLYTRPDAIDLRSVRPYTDELQWIRANLDDTFARYLRAGITSVVDVGGPFWNYDVRATASKTVAAPRVMVAGPLISSVSRDILDPYNDPPIVKIDTVEAAKALIDREIAAKTDYVKFWWIVLPDKPAAACHPVAKAAIEYAHSKGARVVIHATELETARLAVESGTDILAHSVFNVDVDDAFVELLKTHNTIYCPTLIVVGNYGYTFHGTPNLSQVDLRWANPMTVGTLFNMPDVEDALPPATLARIKALRAPEPPHAAMRNLKKLHDAGIVIAAGTDAGNIGTQHASSFYDEALVMVEAGLTPREVLLTATRGGAAMMGRDDLGSIAAGNLADVVVLSADPAADVRALGSIRTVVKDGHVFDPKTMLREPPELIVQRQVNAFNAHDAEVLSETYAIDATVVHGSMTALRSRSAIRAANAMAFQADPKVHVEILERTVSGDVVIDRGRSTGSAAGNGGEATVSYTVRDGEIVRAKVENRS